MKIGVAGPIAVELLSHHLSVQEAMPRTYRYAPMAFWVEELLARGHSVVVFGLAQDLEAPRTLEGTRLRVHLGRYRSHGRARDFFASERSDLLNAMANDPCDVIHAHWTYEFALAALASNQPTLVTAHDAPFSVLRLAPFRTAWSGR